LKIIKKLLAFIIAGFIITFSNASFVWAEDAIFSPSASREVKLKYRQPLEYRLLFFKTDNRIWIIIPPRTAVLEIFPSVAAIHGWVRAYDRHGKTLALDKMFHGDAYVSVAVKNPSVRKNLFVTTGHDKRSVMIFTPENAAFIEILNATNGFDGTVFVRDKKKHILASQSGLDIHITNFEDKK